MVIQSEIKSNVFFIAEAVVEEEEDPCEPNPCGPNSNPPREIGGQCRCTCLPEMIGSPPNCRPECYINSDCPSDKACISRKCQDPCPGLCGVNAYCRVRNHVPICVCNQGYIGDPFSQCRRPIGKFEKMLHLHSKLFYLIIMKKVVLANKHLFLHE